MPIFVVAIVSFACGWTIGAAATALRLSDWSYRVLLGLIAFLAGLLVLAIAVGEANHWPWAFLAEDALVEQRWCAVLLWVLAGFVAYPFRTAIARFLNDLTALALRPPKSGDGAPAQSEPPPEPPPRGGRPEARADVRSSRFLSFSLPWFVEAGFFGAILIAAAFAANPKMLKGLTSFKAGGIEAHFATGGPALQKGQVSVLDANRKSVLSNWQKFQMKGDARAKLYDAVPVSDRWRIEFADLYLKDQLKIVLDVLHKREFSYLKLNAENFGYLQNIATRLSNQIERDLDTDKKKDDKDNTPDRQIYLLNKVSQEIILFRCGTEPGLSDRSQPSDQSQQCSAANLAAVTCRATAAMTDVAGCRLPATYPASIGEIVAHYKEVPSDRAVDIWDPYVIQAVADLLGRALGSRERANFLEVTTSLIEQQHRDNPCRPACADPLPGEMSLVYAAVEAKVESEHPWPFEHMYEQVSNLLAHTRRIVDDETMSEPIRLTARRNRLIDLSLGLQLFYQRALSGQRFTPVQLQSWSDWLKETRAALSILAAVGLWGDPSMDAGEKAAWHNAAPTIADDPAVVQDAATSAALSSVLLPAQSDGTVGADCLKARTLMDFAGNRNLEKFYEDLRFDRDDKATYQGLIDQMKARVESECE